MQPHELTARLPKSRSSAAQLLANRVRGGLVRGARRASGSRQVGAGFPSLGAGVSFSRDAGAIARERETGHGRFWGRERGLPRAGVLREWARTKVPESIFVTREAHSLREKATVPGSVLPLADGSDFEQWLASAVFLVAAPIVPGAHSVKILQERLAREAPEMLIACGKTCRLYYHPTRSDLIDQFVVIVDQATKAVGSPSYQAMVQTWEVEVVGTGESVQVRPSWLRPPVSPPRPWTDWMKIGAASVLYALVAWSACRRMRAKWLQRHECARGGAVLS